MLYNLHIIDGGQQFVKVNPDGDYNDFGTLACSSLEMTPTGRAYVEAHPVSGYDCYTGGFDAHQAWGWSVRDSVIRDIYCSTGLAEHAINIWNASRDPVVERNVLINNARGIGLGLGDVGGQRIYPDDPLAGTGLSPADVQVIGGIVRNNMIFGSIAQFDTGIGLEQVWNAEIFHNTVYS